MTFKAKWWHDLKVHSGLKLKSKGQPVCRYCGLKFDLPYKKYKHERTCTEKGEPTQHQEPEPEPLGATVNETPELLVTEVDIDESIKPDPDANAERETAKCSRCEEEFTSLRGRSIHEKNIHNLDPNECRVCTRIFNSYGARYVHEKKCAVRQQAADEELNSSQNQSFSNM